MKRDAWEKGFVSIYAYDDVKLLRIWRLGEGIVNLAIELNNAQRFLSAFGPIFGHFQPRRHRLSAEEYRAILQTRFQTWNEVTGMKLVS